MRALALLILGGCDLVFAIRAPADADVAPPADVAPDMAVDVGCSDGTREGFADRAMFPRLAGCGGGFRVPGVDALAGPACARQAGDDSANPDGMNCNAEDLCAAGWHVCLSRADVATASGARGCADPALGANLFFITRQPGFGGFCNDTSGIDDLYGCGSQGSVLPACEPLDRTSGNACASLTLGGWSCPDMQAEARTVFKVDASGGGALCCKD